MAQLPIFHLPQPQQELQESFQVEVNPLADIASGPIEFNITGNNDFIDLSATTLHVRAKIVKADGTAYEKDKAEVAFANNALHSMFQDVIVSINETIVEGGEQNYNMKSLISTLFTYSDSTMERQLFAAGFVKDEAGKMDELTNKGYVTRKGWTNGGTSKDFYGKLFVDMFQQPRYLIGNVNMKIKLIRAAHALALWTNAVGEKPKFIIEAATLYLRKVRPHPQIVNDVIMSMSKGASAHYPINRVEISTFPVPANTIKFSKDQLFYGKVPKILVMCMPDNVASSGTYTTNPYNFKHCNASSIDLRIDGESKPILPLTPNFKTKQCLREYMSVLESMNILGKDSFLPFTYDEFLNGYTFLAWNLTPDNTGQPQNPALRSNVRLDIKFDESQSSLFSVLLYAVFDSVVMIDGSGQVITDYKD